MKEHLKTNIVACGFLLLIMSLSGCSKEPSRQTAPPTQPVVIQNTVTPIPTAEELTHVEARGSLDATTFFSGTAYNGLTKDLSGPVLFHFIIKDKKGKVKSDRKIRDDIHWPAQQVHTFNVETGLHFDAETEEYEWTLEAVNASDDAQGTTPPTPYAAEATTSPAEPSSAPPSDHFAATALCNDGTYSYAAHHQGACSHHGGVAEWYR